MPDYVDYTKCFGLGHGTQVGVGHEISCTKYYFCSQGIGILEDCTEIYGDTRIAFNEATGYCGYNVACGRPNRIISSTLAPISLTLAPTVARNAPFYPEPNHVEMMQCPTDRPGETFLLSSSNCSQFFICSNGARMLMSCLKGLLWNEDKNQCDDPKASRCASRQVTFRTFHKSRF